MKRKVEWSSLSVYAKKNGLIVSLHTSLTFIFLYLYLEYVYCCKANHKQRNYFSLYFVVSSNQ
jgi:hypothetical protein